MSAKSPLLSVVVTIVDGGPVLRRFLNALTAQENPPALELIVPYDASVAAEVEAMAGDFPGVSFLNLGLITPEKPITSAAGQHELYDRRRANGLGAAKGDIIAILEDRGAPRPNWAATVVRLHGELPHAVIGGAIEPEPDSIVNWAFYVCDFGRYGLPFQSGPTDWVSDVNVTYKRPALEATRHLWKDRFREPIVHWHLLDKGEILYLSSDLVVDHKCPPMPLGKLLPQRFDWGRLFGHIRAMHMSTGKRFLMSLVGPLIPLRLVVRHGMTQASKGHGGRYILAIPAVLLLTICWTAGEVWGYVTKSA